jgi:hypothetical protein
MAAVLDGVLLPHGLARGGVEGHQAAVEGAHEDLALVQGDAPVHHVAAALEGHFAGHLGS